MSSKSRQLQKRLDAALRALTQIESIAGVAVDNQREDTDTHWILDGIADLAHYALEVAGEPPQKTDGLESAEDAPHDLPDEAVFPMTAETADDDEPDDQGTRRSN
jgi:hypothetical protein